MKQGEIEALQLGICKKFGAEFCPSLPTEKIGVAENIRVGSIPINGLRHPPTADTSGWYIWAGEELCSEADFFKPLHIEHLEEYCPQVRKYLGLAPGWRFLIAGEYEDVWFDPELLNLN